MHILNIMFSAAAGGIEQAFVDYCEAMQKRGHRITAITHPDAAINSQLEAAGISPIRMRQLGKWDIFAVRKIRKLAAALAPDIIITHANRALSLTRRAVRDIPVVGIAHNYTTKLLSGADGVFATTHDLIHHVSQQGVPEERIFHIPNMVRCHELPMRGARGNPPVIGTMGRFVKKKGFDIYIDALKILKGRGYNFTAVLGGTGAEDKALKQHANDSGLGSILTFPGWIGDKKQFYSHIDMFCLPSLHEPFGIVLLEAFIYGTPVIATDSEGPRDIITPNFDALVVEKGKAAALAEAIAKFLDDPDMAAELAANAFVKAKTTYSIEAVGERIEKALEAILSR